MLWSVAVIDGDPKTIAVGTDGGALRKLDATGKFELLSIDAHDDCVTGVAAIAGAEEVVTCSVDATVKHWSLAAEVEGDRLLKSWSHSAPLRCLVSNGETHFAGSSDGSVLSITAEGVSAWEGHLEAVSCLAIGEGILCSGSYDNHLRLWDIATGAPLAALVGFANQVKGCCFINQCIVATSRDETAKVWFYNPDAEAEPVETKDENGDVVPGEARKVMRLEHRGTIDIGSVPHCLSAAGNSVFLGCSDHRIVSIKGRDYCQQVQRFDEEHERQFTKGMSKLEREVAQNTSKAQRAARVSIKKKKKELVARQKDALLAEKQAAKAAAAADHVDADEEDEEAEEAAEPEADFAGDEEDGDVEEVALSEETLAELQEFTEKKNSGLESYLQDLSKGATAHRDALAPIRLKRFHQVLSSFKQSTLTHEYLKGSAPAVAIAVDGATGFIAEGDAVRIVSLVPGVTSL